MNIIIVDTSSLSQLNAAKLSLVETLSSRTRFSLDVLSVAARVNFPVRFLTEISTQRRRRPL